jgi:hypothetical protein
MHPIAASTTRATFVGSMTPTLTRSSSSSVSRQDEKPELLIRISLTGGRPGDQNASAAEAIAPPDSGTIAIDGSRPGPSLATRSVFIVR